MDEHNENEELMREAQKNLLNLSRLQRRQLLREGDTSLDEENPIEQILSHLTFAMAEDQEHAEQVFGEDYIKDYSFSKGAYRWLSEPSAEQRVFIMLGVMMSIQDASTMIDLINDLGLDTQPYMDFAQSQIDHIKKHQKSCNEAMKEAKTELNSEDILSEIESHLKAKE